MKNKVKDTELNYHSWICKTYNKIHCDLDNMIALVITRMTKRIAIQFANECLSRQEQGQPVHIQEKDFEKFLDDYMKEYVKETEELEENKIRNMLQWADTYNSRLPEP